MTEELKTLTLSDMGPLAAAGVYAVNVVIRDPVDKKVRQYRFERARHHRMIDRWLIITLDGGSEQIFPSDLVITAIVEK